MQKITRKYAASDPLHFEIDLTLYPGKTISDIDDIYFLVKKNISDLDSAALLSKSLGAGQISVVAQADPLFLDALVDWLGTEYTGMEVKSTYLGGIFIKWTGDATADENVEDDGVYHIYIKEQFVNQN
jgi:hypothetical protein